ncbi:MAG: UbiH/UbiF/VisC/COQ6 family ubiquinone biosynthesis hydroxylase [Pseudomonadota bacterium]|nr:UbiH/UbiF/VisC/COQ6 family ubiquinone biosynthesis hydroxylase [Pseudomonadota bacterium]
MTYKADVVVAGGGIVGSAFAAALADSSLTVRLISTGEDRRWQSGVHDTRVSAINLASESILSALGVWNDIVRRRISPFREIKVSDSATGRELCFDAADSGLAHLGHIIENSAIIDALHQRLNNSRNITITCNDRIHEASYEAPLIQISTEKGDLITTRLLVGADGAASTVRTLMNIPSRFHAYEQIALVSTVTTSQSHCEIARQRFLSSGPLAFLPLADGRCSIVWSADNAVANELQSMNDERFLNALNTAFSGSLQATAATPRRAFPLEQQHASSYCGRRTALMGDAAHTMHPLAGLGVNLGLLDAASLAEIVLDHGACGRDIGGHSALRAYERWRKSDNTLTLATVDALHRFFRQSHPLATQLRAAGVSFCQRNRWLNSLIIERATGLSGDLPRIAKASKAATYNGRST